MSAEDKDAPAETTGSAAESAPSHWLDRMHIGSPFGSRRKTILALAGGLIVGGLAAGLIGFAVGGFDSDNMGEVTGTRASEQAKVGDCLTWNGAEPSTMSRLDCAKPHKFEVAAKIDLLDYPGKEFAAGADFPGALRFRELRDDHCLTAVNAYLKGRYDPDGRFKVGTIFPGEIEWEKGVRTLLCGLQDSGQTGAQVAFTGRVAELDQSRIWPVGTCIGINGNVPTDPVECSQQHAFEVVGIVDLGEKFTGGAPALDEQDSFIEPKCSEAADQYLGDKNALRNKTLTMFWANLSPTSWLAGTRKIYCSIGKEVDKGGFAKIVGSAKGDITIGGQAPVPPPDLPSGRSMPSPLPGAEPAPIPPPG